MATRYDSGSQHAVLDGATLDKWSEVGRHTNGAHFMWADLYGWHSGALPAEFPIGATHLWGWNGSELFRCRVRPDRSVTIGRLRFGATVGDTAPFHQAEEVTVEASSAICWPPEHGRVAQAVRAGVDTTFSGTVYAVVGPMPIHFLAADER